jgi:hypothetical protein
MANHGVSVQTVLVTRLRCGLHFFMRRVVQAMIPLILETVEPALSRGIVPAIAFTTHRACHAELPQLVLKGIAGILTAAIRVMQDPCSRFGVPRSRRIPAQIAIARFWQDWSQFSTLT